MEQRFAFGVSQTEPDPVELPRFRRQGLLFYSALLVKA
jgi:hypothetical protein